MIVTTIVLALATLDIIAQFFCALSSKVDNCHYCEYFRGKLCKCK